MGEGGKRRRFQYRVCFVIGPFDRTPPFGDPISRMIGIFTRAGYNVRVKIEYLDDKN